MTLFVLKERIPLSSCCVLALGDLGSILIQALIQSQNNRGEIPWQVQYVSCLRCKPIQSNTNLVFPPGAPSPHPAFLFQKGRIHQKGYIAVLPPARVLYIHFISPNTYKILSRPIPFAIDFISFILSGFKNFPHTKSSPDKSLQYSFSRLQHQVLYCVSSV